MRSSSPWIIALVLAGASGSCSHAAVTPPPPDPTFHALSADVEVRRDEWGVPHIYAHTGDDGAYVLGYETARDRLFELDLNRRRALGREAELFGQASLADDQIARIVGFAAIGEAGEADLEKNDPEVYRALSAYAAGISAFMADAAAGKNGAKLPPEYADLDPTYRPDPWRVSDTIALLKAELFLLAAHPETDLLSYAVSAAAGADVYLDLYRPDPLEKVYITGGFPAGCPAKGAALDPAPGACPGAEAQASRGGGVAAGALALADALAHHARRHRIGPTAASNNWVLCGGFTASGATMLANDPHLSLDLPTNFHEFHLESDEPGKPVRMAGFGFPGVPAVALGHNAAAAWGVTTVEADVADAYLETVAGDAVSFEGKMVPMTTRTEVIHVRKPGGKVGDFDEVDQTVRVVPHHGPVLSDASDPIKLLLGPDHAISLRWLGYGVTHEARAFYDLMRASSFADFQAALGKFEAGLFNFVYAGTDGDIGYYPHASYPIRAKLDPASPPYGVMPGTGAYEWTGALIPDACIPQAKNPPSCRIWSANNDPAGVTASGSTLDDAYYLGGTFDYALRAKRIGDRLAALSMGAATLDDLGSIQGDVHAGLADHFVPPLLAAAAGATLTPAASTLLQTLAAWDGDERADAVAPTVFSAFYSQLLVDVFADDLPLVFADLATDDRFFAPVLSHLLAGEATPSGHDYLGGKAPAAVLVAALEEVAVSLPAALGADMTQWTWGQVHTNTFNHPLGGKYDIGPIPLGGGLSTLDSARYSPTVNGDPVLRPDVIEGPNVRIQVELVPGAVRMRAALPPGESGVLGDPHYQDQLSLWESASVRDAHFSRDDVVAHAPTAVVFPKGAPGK